MRDPDCFARMLQYVSNMATKDFYVFDGSWFHAKRYVFNLLPLRLPKADFAPLREMFLGTISKIIPRVVDQKSFDLFKTETGF